MKSSISFLLILLIIVALSQLADAANTDYNYELGRNSGIFSPMMQAQEIGNNPSQYFICKISYLESRWVKSLYNCKCRNSLRKYYGKRLQCNWCDN